MNMPKRASCHHFIRRMRSASPASEEACGGFGGVPGWRSAAAAFEEAASVTSEALVPNSQSRRGIRFGPMASTSFEKTSDSELHFQPSRRVIGPCCLLFKLENSFHQHPLFAGLGIRKRLLKLPHQLFPLAHFRIFAIRLCFSLEGETLVDFHHHEHARAKEIDFHVF